MCLKCELQRQGIQFTYDIKEENFLRRGINFLNGVGLQHHGERPRAAVIIMIIKRELEIETKYPTEKKTFQFYLRS